MHICLTWVHKKSPILPLLFHNSDIEPGLSFHEIEDTTFIPSTARPQFSPLQFNSRDPEKSFKTLSIIIFAIEVDNLSYRFPIHS
jgi:hypothetical protein